MKLAFSLTLGLVMLGLITSVGVQGQEKDKGKDKTVTLKGIITCTKCDLGETTECGHVIKVKENEKDVLYYFVDKGAAEKYHAKICTSPAKGSVTGTTGEKDKKKTITPAKDGVKYD
jgi:hypothetical protein